MVMTSRMPPNAASTSKLPASLRSYSSTDMVRVRGPTRKTAADNSRVATMNTISQPPSSARLTSGAVTKRMALSRPPPRIRTASSISGWTERIAAFALA